MGFIHQYGEAVLVNIATGGDTPAVIHAAGIMHPHPIINRGIRRAGIETDQSAILSLPSDVSNPAKIKHGDRFISAGAFQQCCVIAGAERCTMPACRDIIGPKVKHHGPPDHFRHQRAIAELAGLASSSFVWRPMKHCLAMESNGGDLLKWKIMRQRGVYNRPGLGAGQGALGFGKNRRFITVEIPILCVFNGLGDHRPHIIGVGNHGRRAEFRDAVAVGADKGDVDLAIENRSGHQARKPSRRFHGLKLALICHDCHVLFTLKFRWRAAVIRAEYNRNHARTIALCGIVAFCRLPGPGW